MFELSNCQILLTGYSTNDYFNENSVQNSISEAKKNWESNIGMVKYDSIKNLYIFQKNNKNK